MAGTGAARPRNSRSRSTRRGALVREVPGIHETAVRQDPLQLPLSSEGTVVQDVILIIKINKKALNIQIPF